MDEGLGQEAYSSACGLILSFPVAVATETSCFVLTHGEFIGAVHTGLATELSQASLFLKGNKILFEIQIQGHIGYLSV